jgi:hypothetical protein
MIQQLTKQSTAQEIKSYFEEVLKLSKDSKEFPVNLDDVWPLVYSAKEKAVRALKSNDLFLQNVDYQVLAKNGENSGVLAQNGGKVRNGRPTEIYMLSVPCLEFFIARKVRPVFEVYRQVFHKVASGELPLRMSNCIPGNTVGTLAPLVQFHAIIMKRYAQLVNDSMGNEEIKEIMKSCNDAYMTYRIKVSNLPFIEAVGILEGKEALQDRPLLP